MHKYIEYVSSLSVCVDTEGSVTVSNNGPTSDSSFLRVLNHRKTFYVASRFYEKLVPTIINYNIYYELCVDQTIGKDIRTYHLASYCIIAFIVAISCNYVSTHFFAKRLKPITETMKMVRKGNLTSFPIMKKDDVVTNKEEIACLRSYLELFQFRLGGRMQFVFEIEEEIYPEFDIIERSMRLTNEREPVVIENLKSASVSIPRQKNYRVRYLSGKWAAESHMEEQYLTTGGFTIQSRTGNTGPHFNPDFSYTLYKGESIQTPVMTVGFTAGGYGTMSRKLHAFENNHLLPGRKTGRVLYNSWEAILFDVRVES